MTRNDNQAEQSTDIDTDTTQINANTTVADTQLETQATSDLSNPVADVDVDANAASEQSALTEQTEEIVETQDPADFNHFEFTFWLAMRVRQLEHAAPKIAALQDKPIMVALREMKGNLLSMSELNKGFDDYFVHSLSDEKMQRIQTLHTADFSVSPTLDTLAKKPSDNK